MIDPNDRSSVEQAYGRPLYCALGVVPSAEFHVRKGVLYWERLFLEGGRKIGFIRLGIGCSCWHWTIAYGDVCASSKSVYDTPQLAMERGQVAYDAVVAGGKPRVDWCGDPRGFDAEIALHPILWR